MKVPPDPDDFDPKEFPHFNFFCNVQLGRAMTSWTEHWENAEAVAKIPEKELFTIKTLDELAERGVRGVFG